MPDVAGEDSFSFLPLLDGDPAQEPARTHIIHHSGDGMFAVRKDGWKLVQGLGSGGFSEPKWAEPGPDAPPGQRYHLAEDP